MASFLYLIIVSIVLPSIFNTKPIDSSIENTKFRVISIKDCNNTKDSLRMKKLNYPSVIQMPGSIQFNGTGTVISKLPEDWNLRVNLKMKVPFLGWMDLPCLGICDMKNFCNQEMIQECKDSLKNNSTQESEEICKCDYDPGEYNLPTLKLPIKGLNITDAGDMKSLMMDSAKGKDIKMEITLRSSKDNKRFGCFRGTLRLV